MLNFSSPSTFILLLVFIELYQAEDPQGENSTSTVPRTKAGRRFVGIEVTEGVLKVDNNTKVQLTNYISTWFVPTIYILVCSIGLPANGLALGVLLTKVRRFPSTIFLINLAVADLLLILVLPLKISYHFLNNNWLFGEVACRVFTAFLYGNMYCSVLFLMCISLDRYFALVHPFWAKVYRGKKVAVIACLMIWVIVAASVTPFTLQKQSYNIQDLNITTCNDVLPLQMDLTYSFYHFWCLAVLGFVIPFFIIMFCYISILWTLGRSGQKYGHPMRVTVLVLVAFALCFAPTHIVFMMHYSETQLEKRNLLYIVSMLLLALSTVNSCLDPFIYYYVSEEFQTKLKNTVCPCFQVKQASSATNSQMLFPIRLTKQSSSLTVEKDSKSGM
ncbi:proteinase-activated receptor 4-like [Latimeria chalumnae]|uniref:G-protein coupled receptors family 1 profile domain-containing protein n=1 Tax=Latimeria chalumnae TaxID=7897 RepID=H3AY95_LATCH|nr:PREDICTED: proteinase-activated receptor 4-like [Latimeria chalumnae]XP_014343542.1 PREDICTED: proteinase-activated receptor 4-like [Latimeria chalumnae]|eukprot:XP_005995406.1 PREDICTED: proteinase-activated receptor 4-like [Latimeria chalumnae]